MQTSRPDERRRALGDVQLETGNWRTRNAASPTKPSAPHAAPPVTTRDDGSQASRSGWPSEPSASRIR